MGKKIPYDQAARLASVRENTSIYALPNRSGYKINVNHPQIRPLYEAYLRRIGEHIPSDAQRLTFEAAIFRMIRERSKHVQPSNSDGQTDEGS